MSDQATQEILGKLGALETTMNDIATAINDRLREGDLLFKEHGYTLEVAMRAVQVLLLKEATDREIIESLADVTTALERLSRRNGVPESDLAPHADDIDTQPNNPIPSRDSDPGDE